MRVIESAVRPVLFAMGIVAAQGCTTPIYDPEPVRHGLPLPDDAFEHDGQMTKRETRAATLAALAPLPGQLLWDVGAGCGSVAIEWMRPGGRAIGIEPQPAGP